MATVSKGVVVRVKYKSGDHGFKGGDVVTSTGNDFGPHHAGVWTQFVDTEGYRQYLLPSHYDLVEDTKTVEKKVVVEEAVEASDETLPNKVIYGVLNAEDEIYASTADRDFARELKAALGGKRKGVRIFQYAAVKEIR